MPKLRVSLLLIGAVARQLGAATLSLFPSRVASIRALANMFASFFRSLLGFRHV